jgi:hypothetical protein
MRSAAIILLLVLSPGVIGMGESTSELAALLPEVAGEWRVVEDKSRRGEALYEYINGGAELYLSYGFKEVLSRTFSRAGGPDIIVDLFDMETSENAFGVFCHSRETVDDTFGQGSQYTEGLLLFWKGGYFVSVLASPETSEAKEAVFAIAHHIDAEIPSGGKLPAMLSLLPPESLVEESIRYFHHYVWLNSHYYVADKNILNIDETTNALLAKYGDKDERRILLAVRYATPEAASAAYDSFLRHYLPEAARNMVVRIEDDTWAGCRLDHDLLTVVLNASSRDAAGALLDEVRRRNEGE